VEAALATQYHRFLRAVGFGIWITLLLPVLVGAHRRAEGLDWSKAYPWIALWLVFGAALWLATAPTRWKPKSRIAMLVVQTLAAISMSWLQPNYYVGFLLVVIAWQLALLLPETMAAIWVFAQSLLLLIILAPICKTGWGWAASGIYLGFQCFALMTGFLARREMQAKAEQARINVELLATRELLAESSRSFERLRISQELHDVLGHRLTALSLHLEIALNSVPPGKKEAHILKAQEVTRDLLMDVREVVGALRHSEGVDVDRALRVLSTTVPGLAVHVSKPDRLRIQDPERGQSLLRCVQELITNTLKHGQASNLWITIDISDDILRLDANDDGCGGHERIKIGFGLSGMRDRFERLGGGIEINKPSPKGFSLSAWMPLTPGLMHT
jgi:signal transduction histidine kinase